jgi:hypothetical protein
VLSAFIPDKFFKDYEAEFKRLSAEPLSHGMPTAIYLMKANVIPLVEQFRKEIIGLAPVSRPGIDSLARACLASIKSTCDSYFHSSVAVNYQWPKTRLECVMGHIGNVVNAKVSADVKTLGKALKTPITIDPAKVKALAARALKEATPEEAAAVELYESPIAAAFYADHVDGSIPRLIKKGKVDLDLVKWVGLVRTTLSNYATGKGRYLEFELAGMKVVIDDWSVGPDDHDKYVEHLNAAYHLLKRRKLDRAWYGTVFIDCQTCDGRPDVRGHYNIQEDHVKIFLRPSPQVVDVMVHELGHRYWFKSMSQGQRAKFESLVLIREDSRPGGESRINPDGLDAKDDVAEMKGEALRALEQGEKEVILGRMSVVQLRRSMGQSIDGISALEEIALRAARLVDSRGKALHKDVQNAVREAVECLEKPPDAFAAEDSAVLEVWTEWFATARQLIRAAALASNICLEHAFSAFNEHELGNRTPEQKAWDEEVREILPVSEYGKTNIDEAFAEAFKFYVLGMKMNADQKASFKAVLLDKDRAASKVAERYLAETVHPRICVTV